MQSLPTTTEKMGEKEQKRRKKRKKERKNKKNTGNRLLTANLTLPHYHSRETNNHRTLPVRRLYLHQFQKRCRLPNPDLHRALLLSTARDPVTQRGAHQRRHTTCPDDPRPDRQLGPTVLLLAPQFRSRLLRHRDDARLHPAVRPGSLGYHFPCLPPPVRHHDRRRHPDQQDGSRYASSL